MAVIKVDDLETAVHDIIEEYFDGVATESERVVAEVSAQTVLDLKTNSPENPKGKKRGSYKRGWRLKQTKKQKNNSEVTIYNTQAGLTHLLENGHVKVVHGYVLGFTSPKEHIRPAEKTAVEKLEKGIVRAIKK